MERAESAGSSSSARPPRRAGGPVERAYTGDRGGRAGASRAARTIRPYGPRPRAPGSTVERPYPQARSLAGARPRPSSRAGDRDAARPRSPTAIAAAERLGAAWLAARGQGPRARAGGSASRPPATADGDDARRPRPSRSGSPRASARCSPWSPRGRPTARSPRELFMAEKTASVHVSRILTKLDVRSRTEAAAVAYRHGLAARGRGRAAPNPAEPALRRRGASPGAVAARAGRDKPSSRAARPITAAARAQLVGAVVGHHRQPQARAARRDGRRADRLGEDAALERALAERHRAARVADDAPARSASASRSCAQALGRERLAQRRRVAAQLLDQPGRGLEQRERGERGADRRAAAARSSR